MKRILVLGASGYIGSQLIPQLLQQGHKVTAAARQIDYLKSRVLPHSQLNFCYLDLADPQATLEIVPQHDVVYFLVHGMAHGHDFLEYELSLAQNFKTALDASSVQHVIYLSALQPQTGNSAHLAARRETGHLLRQSQVPITELQAGVVIGSGSAAYEIMCDFIYNLPFLVVPQSVDSKANPIALQNLNHYLLALAEHRPKQHSHYQVGGPDILTYQQQMEIIAKQINKPLRLIKLGLMTPKLATRWLSLVTSVPASIGSALLAGIEHDFIADNHDISQLYPQHLIPYDQAVTDSLKQADTFVKSNVWGFDPAALKRWQTGYGYYPKKTGASFTTTKSTAALWQAVAKIGSKEKGYYFANSLWRTREWLDLLFGGGRPIRRSPEGPELKVGDFIDSWKVIRCDKPYFLSLLFGMKGPGLGRLEVSIEDLGETRKIDITAWWHPQGFLGLLYWFAMMPAHLFIFKGMVRALCRQASDD
ncbi:DUF2867 domain-containing protein [Vibrio hippocampi]|uniref:NAD(P)-binding domain-containing protein n=1 Tax=Vibrio hippocampi TaxID=654686 RepID=A0ABN8DG50_9VIBR|nr:DUF2867 domain-containing protein [Vibrio hippocampi]CAH0526064.1 hypothetical protein VHP8226_01550 [Vibrio hippocampi]